MRLKRRTKSSRYRGTHTHGRGFKKKARGSGHQGGVGMSGTGKRGDQKKTLILTLYGNDYFGKDKTLRRGNKPFKPSVINLQYIQDNLSLLIKSGKAKETKEGTELNLNNYKVLGEGDIKSKLIIKARAISASARDKVEKAGGKVILQESKEDKIEKAEKKEEKK